MGMAGPANTLPMMAGQGQFGPIEMGGMFTVVKVRDDQAADDYRDPGWYRYPKGKIARRVSSDADFGQPVRRDPYAPAQLSQPPAEPPAAAPMDHSKHGMKPGG
jgi:hypothetical protein